ncbi:uncharacterized protein LDX57_007744 [Aspergillus melleus]|uniref:uncharacterized protein n=1 Tax=Aspergillus melleus TaxID=138277 RepID=UPI001E8E1BD7|nr:uncharacterized protein LDX57_007744 [Aspergillus melleus]KAH8430073.1 hypothetical protein LDX57_007744 [Aspergillus melleus]
MSCSPQPYQIVKLNDQEIIATDVELLDPRRSTVYRLKLKLASHQNVIPDMATSVIVKQQKDGWEEEFEVEKMAYNRLAQLQGEVIPYFYGQGSFNGLPAIVLSDIDGIAPDYLARSSNDEISEDSLEAYLEKVFREFSKCGVLYRDQKLDSFLLCYDKDRRHGKVMVVDLEQVEFPSEVLPWQYGINQEGARSLMEEFKHQRNPTRESPPLELWKCAY